MCSSDNRHTLLKQTFPVELRKHSPDGTENADQSHTSADKRRGAESVSAPALPKIPETAEIEQGMTVVADRAAGAVGAISSRPSTLTILPSGSKSTPSLSLSSDGSGGKKGKVTFGKDGPVSSKQRAQAAKRALAVHKKKTLSPAVTNPLAEKSPTSQSSSYSEKTWPRLGDLGHLGSSECQADVEDFDANSPLSPPLRAQRPTESVPSQLVIRAEVHEYAQRSEVAAPASQRPNALTAKSNNHNSPGQASRYYHESSDTDSLVPVSAPGEQQAKPPRVQKVGGSPQPRRKKLSHDQRKLSSSLKELGAGIKGSAHFIYSSLDNTDEEEQS